MSITLQSLLLLLVDDDGETMFLISNFLVYPIRTRSDLDDAVKEFKRNKGPLLFGPISDWDISHITDLSNLFENLSYSDKKNFHFPLQSWDVSKVTSMKGLFYDFESFNQPLQNWDVSNVTNMERMFYSCRSFNQPLATWNVSKVTNMQEMFSYCKLFNQSLRSWDLRQVTKIGYMFSEAIAMYQEVGSWEVIRELPGRETLFYRYWKDEKLPMIYQIHNFDSVMDLHKTLGTYLRQEQQIRKQILAGKKRPRDLDDLQEKIHTVMRQLEGRELNLL